MAWQPGHRGCDDVARETYAPEQDQSLGDAIVDAIEACRGEDLLRTDFDLFEDVYADALEDLVRRDADPGTRLTIETDSLEVELWRDDGVEIRVEDLTGE